MYLKPFHTVVSQDTSLHSTCDQLAVKETTLRGSKGGREGRRERVRDGRGTKYKEDNKAWFKI